MRLVQFPYLRPLHYKPGTLKQMNYSHRHLDSRRFEVAPLELISSRVARVTRRRKALDSRARHERTNVSVSTASSSIACWLTSGVRWQVVGRCGHKNGLVHVFGIAAKRWSSLHWGVRGVIFLNKRRACMFFSHSSSMVFTRRTFSGWCERIERENWASNGIAE